MATTASSTAEALPVKSNGHFFGATRRASLANTTNMLLCWTSTNEAIAATNTAMPISIAHATGIAPPALDRAANNVTPAMTKTSWVATPTVTSTTMAAAAFSPGTPR